MKNLKLKINLFFLSILLLSFSSLSAAGGMSQDAYASNGNGMMNNNNGMMNNNNGMMNNNNGMMNNDCPPLGVNIFDGNDEREAYNDHGFSRGDVAYLFNADYDASTEEMISGRVMKVFRVRFPDNDCYTIAIVSTNAGPLLVNLGPVWFSDEQEIKVQEGDNIGVKGSKLRSNGRFVMIASQVKLNNKTMRLKNGNGKNEWNTPRAQKWGPSTNNGNHNGNGGWNGDASRKNNGWPPSNSNGNGQHMDSSSSNQWGLK